MPPCPEGYITILLAEVEGAPAGCVALREIERPERASEMKRLWVGNGFRGLRLGRLLVEKAIEWANKRGFESMYLDSVPAAMPEANRLYASLGFYPDGNATTRTRWRTSSSSASH